MRLMQRYVSRFETKAVNFGASSLMMKRNLILGKVTPEGQSGNLSSPWDQFPRKYVSQHARGFLRGDELALSVAERMVKEFQDLKVPSRNAAPFYLYAPSCIVNILRCKNKLRPIYAMRALEDEKYAFSTRKRIVKLIENIRVVFSSPQCNF